MKRTKLLLLLGLALAAAAVGVLMLRNPPPPPMPADPDHVFRGPDACLTCHGPDGGAPQSSTHPIGRECMRCHGG